MRRNRLMQSDFQTSRPRLGRITGVLMAAGFAASIATGTALGSNGADDNRPLPLAQSVTLKLDDALRMAADSAPAMKIVQSDMARHGSRWVYLIRMNRNSAVKLMKIDCSTGEMIVSRRERVRGARLTGMKQTYRAVANIATTRDEAIKAAQEALPGGRVWEVELDDLNDRPVWKVKMLDGARRVIVLVDAATGAVLTKPTDGVADITFDEIASLADALYPGFETVKVELDDDRGCDDSGSHYEVRMWSTDGSQRRDLKFSAASGSVVRDRVRSVSDSNAARNAQVVAATPAISFTKAAIAAADSMPGSFVHEVELKFEDGLLVYEVELFGADASSTEVYVNATTGAVVGAGPSTPGGGGNPGSGGTAVTSAQAIAIAMAAFPGLNLREISQDVEDAGPVFEVKLVSNTGARTDVQVLIATGQIVRVRQR